MKKKVLKISAKKIKIKKKNKERRKLDSKDWFQWIFATLLLALFMSILSGTVSYYLGTDPIIFGLYINWELFFWIIGIAIWGLISFCVFKD